MSTTVETEMGQSVPESSEEQVAWMQDWWAGLTSAEQTAYCTKYGSSDLNSPTYEADEARSKEFHSELVLNGTIPVDWPIFNALMFANCS